LNTYQIDTLVQLSTTFTAADGVTPIDPDTALLFIQTPAGIVSEYTATSTPPVVRESTGSYQLQILVDQPGPWIYKWQGTGDVEITSPDVYFMVAQSAVLGPNACC
jgi:hypothetical protein